jgi:hypothetical protein
VSRERKQQDHALLQPMRQPCRAATRERPDADTKHVNFIPGG